MKRQWTIKRHLMENPDGQNRWDQAYQLLLNIEMPREKGAAGTVQAIPQTTAHQENPDENSAVWGRAEVRAN
jgi:hypothetical protein